MRKHRNDYNHGKHGYVGGNPRHGKARGNFRGERAKIKTQLRKQLAS